MLVLLMGPERYAIDFYENRDLFDSLYNAIAEKDREMYKLAAESPAEFVIYGDNITSDNARGCYSTITSICTGGYSDRICNLFACEDSTFEIIVGTGKFQDNIVVYFILKDDSTEIVICNGQVIHQYLLPIPDRKNKL